MKVAFSILPENRPMYLAPVNLKLVIRKEYAEDIYGSRI